MQFTSGTIRYAINNGTLVISAYLQNLRTKLQKICMGFQILGPGFLAYLNFIFVLKLVRHKISVPNYFLTQKTACIFFEVKLF